MYRLPEPHSLHRSGPANAARDALSITQLAAIDGYKRRLEPTPRLAGLAADNNHTDNNVEAIGLLDGSFDSSTLRLSRMTTFADSSSSSTQRAEVFNNEQSLGLLQSNLDVCSRADKPATGPLSSFEFPLRRHARSNRHGSQRFPRPRHLQATIKRLNKPVRRRRRLVPPSTSKGESISEAGSDDEAEADRNPRPKKRVRLPPRAPAPVLRQQSKDIDEDIVLSEPDFDFVESVTMSEKIKRRFYGDRPWLVRK